MNIKFFKAYNILNKAVWLGGATLVFVLPWFIPPIKRVISDSYNMGFNNMVAVLGVGLSLLALIGLRLWAVPKTGSDNTRESHFANSLQDALENPDFARFTRRDFNVAILASGVAVTVAYFWWTIVPFHNYGEMKSFIPCSELILLGRKPYTEFQFNYGPLFLYLPVWLVHLSGNAMGADVGYIFSLVIFSTFGLFLLAYATTIIEAKWRPWIFILVSLPFILNLDLGLQYTAMRFAAPFAALLWLHRNSQLDEQSKNLWLSWRIGLAFVIGAVFCFAISPDSGLGFLAAAVFYLIALMRRQTAAGKANLACCLIFGIAGASLFLWILSKDYLQSIGSFGSGGYNFPIFPSPYNLFYLFSLALVVPALAIFGIRYHGTKAALAIGWTVLSVIFVAPALGRCDPGHIFCNGIGVFLGGFALLSTNPARRLAIYAALFAILFPIGLPILTVVLTKKKLEKAYHLSYKQGVTKLDRMFWKAALPADQQATTSFAAALKPYPRIGTPLGCEEFLEIYLKRTGKFVPEFYTAPAYGAFTEEEVTQKIIEISRMPIILVPMDSAEIVNGERTKNSYGQEEGKLMHTLMVFPFDYIWRRRPLFPDAEWAKYIREHFLVLQDIGPYYLMMRRDLVQRPPLNSPAGQK